MIRVRVKTSSDLPRVLRQVQQRKIETLAHAGAAIRRAALRGIRRRKGPAPAGQPPHTHTRRLPRAIKYAVEPRQSRVVIGPDVASLGTAGAAHEHGGAFRGEQYPARPFMGPGLAKVQDRLPKLWAGSVR